MSREQSAKSTTETESDLIQSAEFHYRRGRFATALNACHRLLEAKPNCEAALDLMFRLLAKNRDDGNLLENLLQSAAASQAQMSKAQYQAVAVEILHRAPARCLVFGAGRDSALYTRANRGGATCIVEHHPSWIETLCNVPCEVVLVSYTTRIADGLIDPCPRPLGLPDSIADGAWDVVLVDSPEGFAPHCPGRQQPIALAAELRRAGGRVFVHDAQRWHESKCIEKHLGIPAYYVAGNGQLAVFD